MQKGICPGCGYPMVECNKDLLVWFVCEDCGTEVKYGDDNIKQKVIIDIEIEDNYDRPQATLNLSVDGDIIGSGCIGGEPEDNSLGRDYNWIAPLMIKLAEKLGADAETKITEK